MKVVLVGGWARERILDDGAGVEQDHEDIQRYAYATGLLKAVVADVPEVAASTDIALRNYPIELFQQRLTDAELDSILSESPDVVGFSCRCWDVRAFLASAAELKARSPRTRILLGGPSASFDSAQILAEHPAVDVIARGEAEATFLALCRAGFRDLAGIAGITWRDASGKIHDEEGYPAPVDLEAIPSPYLSGAFIPPLHRILVEHARGCRFQCGFCAIPRIRRRLGHRGSARFSAELRWAVDRGYTSIDVSSSAINHDTLQLRSICDVLRTFDRGIGVQAYLQLEPIDQEQLELLRSVHFGDLIVGIESVDDGVRRLCGKGPLDRPGLERKLAALCDTGQTMNLFNILGLPGDTAESFHATVDYLDDLTRRYAGAMCVSFAWHTLLPGSGFWARRAELGIATSQIGMASVMRTAQCSWEDLATMARLVVERAQRNPGIRTDNFTHLAAADRLDPARLLAGQPPLRDGPRGGSSRPGTDTPQERGDDLLRFAFLLKPWSPGDRRDGWSLERAHGVADGRDFAALVFTFERGGVTGTVHIHLAPRDDHSPAYRRSRLLDIRYRTDAESPLPATSLNQLLRTVCTLIARNEGQLDERMAGPRG